jgi:hypothetical protein
MGNPLAAFAAIVVLVGGVSVAVAPHDQQTVTPFQVVLERSAHGWSAQCDSGCSWTAISFECRSQCAAIVDNNGVRTAVAPATDSASFSFRVQQTADGWRADSASGVTWTSLVWSCKTGSCRALLDPYGVTAAPKQR